MKPNPVDQLTDVDERNVDCLLCHGPNYKRTVALVDGSPAIVPAPDVDVLASARNAQRPTNEMCLRCHLKAGGGPNFKHGVVPTSPDVDVHLAAGLQCLSCHVARNHKIAGGADLKAEELPEEDVSCERCHTNRPHRGVWADRLNGHVSRVACQTCHIPLIARDPNYPTQTFKDWTGTPVLKPNGLYAPPGRMANNVVPTYAWWNGQVRVPPGPIGSIDDPNARIYPWKAFEVVAPRDAESKEPLWIKIGVFLKTGNLDMAIQKGVEASGQSYSGTWEPFTEDLLFSVNHQVAPASEALFCNDCHTAEGRLDFEALGYSAERAAELRQAFHQMYLPVVNR